jgi:anti-anti-sigma factor
LLLKQEGAPMFSVDLSIREFDGHVVVALGGELDVMDAAGVAAALVTLAEREPEIIVDLAALEFIDSNGVAALARGRKLARHAGGDLLLAAPRHQVLRVLAITRLVDDFSVHASVEEAANSARGSRRVVVPLQRRRRMRWPNTATRLGAQSFGAEHGSPRRLTGEALAPPGSRAAEPMTVGGWPGFPVSCPQRGEARSGRGALVADCADDG